MKSLLLSAAVMTVILTACSKEPDPPKVPAQPAPKAAPSVPPVTAPAVPPPAPTGEMTQEEKDKVAKDAIDAAKGAARKGE